MGEAGLLLDSSLSVRTLTVGLSYLFPDHLQEGPRRVDCFPKASSPSSSHFPVASRGLSGLVALITTESQPRNLDEPLSQRLFSAKNGRFGEELSWPGLWFLDLLPCLCLYANQADRVCLLNSCSGHTPRTPHPGNAARLQHPHGQRAPSTDHHELKPFSQAF